MNFKTILEKINFVSRYKCICENYHDFDNRMRDSTKQIQKEVLNLFKYKYKYVSNGSFYQVKDESQDILFNLHLVLKGGAVETLIYIYIDNKFIKPRGRIDFFPEDVGILYDRLKYGLPKYSSEKELEEILEGLFSIYEDLKTEVVKEYN